MNAHQPPQEPREVWVKLRLSKREVDHINKWRETHETNDLAAAVRQLMLFGLISFKK